MNESHKKCPLKEDLCELKKITKNYYLKGLYQVLIDEKKLCY